MQIIALISNIFTIFASGIAIYLFLFKRNVISNVFKILLSYSFQITLSELKEKLARLNGVNASENKEEAINIFHEVIGQINGNKKLRKQCFEILEKIEALIKNPKTLSEAKKRSMVSELRENIKYINIENLDDFMGGS